MTLKAGLKVTLNSFQGLTNLTNCTCLLRIFPMVKGAFRYFKISHIHLIFYIFLLLGPAFLFGADKPVIKIGDRPPEFFLSDLNGKLVSLHQFKGNVVVLYFWADWCCKDRTLLSDDLFYEKYKGKGVVILAINAGQPKRVVEQFVKERSITYEVLLDLKFTATKQYGVLGLPTIFVLDRDGIVRKRILGQMEIHYLEKTVLELL